MSCLLKWSANLFLFLVIGRDCSWVRKRLLSMTCQLLQAPLPSRALSYWISPSSFLNKLSSWCLKSRVCSLPLAAFSSSLRILNSSISWSQQPKLPLIISPVSLSLLVNSRSTCVFPSITFIKELALTPSQKSAQLLGSSCVATPIDCNKVKIPSKSQGLWFIDLKLFKEDFLCFLILIGSLYNFLP